MKLSNTNDEVAEDDAYVKYTIKAYEETKLELPLDFTILGNNNITLRHQINSNMFEYTTITYNIVLLRDKEFSRNDNQSVSLFGSTHDTYYLQDDMYYRHTTTFIYHTIEPIIEHSGSIHRLESENGEIKDITLIPDIDLDDVDIYSYYYNSTHWSIVLCYSDKMEYVYPRDGEIKRTELKLNGESITGKPRVLSNRFLYNGYVYRILENDDEAFLEEIERLDLKENEEFIFISVCYQGRLVIYNNDSNITTFICNCNGIYKKFTYEGYPIHVNDDWIITDSGIYFYPDIKIVLKDVNNKVVNKKIISSFSPDEPNSSDDTMTLVTEDGYVYKVHYNDVINEIRSLVYEREAALELFNF